MSIYDPFNKAVLRRSIESGQYVSVAYTERLAEIGALASIGSIGDSYDCEDPRVEVSSLRGSPVPLSRAV